MFLPASFTTAHWEALEKEEMDPVERVWHCPTVGQQVAGDRFGLTTDMELL